jgi:hypothetical protein
VIVEIDKHNYANRRNVQSLLAPKKRAKPTQDTQIDTDKRQKRALENFVEIGSVSWTLMLTIYFLSLHKGI